MKATDIVNMFERASFKGRHGDVVIVNAGKCATEGTRTNVLAEGEATGHAHRIDSARAKRVADAVTQRLLTIAKKSVTLDHEEHKAQQIPKGTYRSGIQAQWTPEGLRRVAD